MTFSNNNSSNKYFIQQTIVKYMLILLENLEVAIKLTKAFVQ